MATDAVHKWPALDVRWLGRVSYGDALAVQEAMFRVGRSHHLLLLEHPHVFTYGPSADLSTNLKCVPSEVGADFVAVNRGETSRITGRDNWSDIRCSLSHRRDQTVRQIQWRMCVRSSKC